MSSEIPSFKRCCFCAPLTYGILGWAYLKLVFSIPLFGISLIWLIVNNIFIIRSLHTTLLELMIAFVQIFVLFDIVFSFVLIIGAHKKDTTLMRLYYRYGMVHGAVLTFGFVSIELYWIIVGDIFRKSNEWEHLIFLPAICFLFLVLHVYLMLLVRSEVMKLKANGEFRFVNHTAGPTCVMQTIDFPPTFENNGGVTEKILC